MSLAPLAKHTAAFSSAATLVVNNSESAYKTAIDLHDQEQISAGAIKIQNGEAWNLHEMKPLITPEGLKARTDVLDALKSYAQSLSDVTSGLDSPALSAAATATGSNLKTLGDEIKANGATSGFSLDAPTSNLVSTATLALGEYLESRKVKAAIPSITKDMDPQIETLCKLLTDDIDVVRRQSKKDYEDLLRQQWVFIQMNKEKFSPVELRSEMATLGAELKNEQSTDAMLADLHSAIGRLAMTHHALAAAAQGNNPEALKARIADLESAGADLGHYYQGLPTK